ncbi:ESCRT-II complex subunit VPS22 [Strigomonas culicis]|uniref:ESCRT-II complex subunit VPS22 n=1 Tax=Strigomonas culicis TaxID=28005 RepID=S9U453_9TRYP|nr:ESCRT-II complex subunit VPS22 [Strigomonas culicis]|eukprot:EPY23713.1 ESCRT-II complex subunit VPS22 [Strigomonas culicis]
MRRGIGVAHVQQKQKTTQQMADLGAQITAERVGQVQDQLEQLEEQLRVLAKRHREEIKHDPVVRARFRQLADSLGVDLISSKKNVFAGALGLGDFYYSLAGKVVEACMKESKFCGAFVPLKHVVAAVQKSYDAVLSAGSGDKRTVISQEDVLTSLGKLHRLGAGYNVVELNGHQYIQTTPDGAGAKDQIALMNYALAQQKKKMEKARGAARAAPAPTPPASSTAAQRAAQGPLLGAAYVLGEHPLAEEGGGSAGATATLAVSDQCVSVTEREVAEGLGWEVHRTQIALERMVQDGTVWVEYRTLEGSERGGVGVGARKGSAPAKALSATESNEVWQSSSAGRGVKKGKPTSVNDNIIYWLFLATHA